MKVKKITNIKKTIIFFLVFFPFTKAIAYDCDSGITSEMIACANDSYKKADKTLNITYKKLISSIDDHQKKLLVNAQNKWINYRDAECEFVTAEDEGGSIYPISFLSCLEDKTVQRTKELERFWQNFESYK